MLYFDTREWVLCRIRFDSLNCRIVGLGSDLAVGGFLLSC